MRPREIDIQKINSIKLPRGWRQGKAYIIENKDVLIVKKYSVPDFSYVRSNLRQLKDRISQKDINQAINSVRG